MKIHGKVGEDNIIIASDHRLRSNEKATSLRPSAMKPVEKGYDVLFRRAHTLLQWIQAGHGDGAPPEHGYTDSCFDSGRLRAEIHLFRDAGQSLRNHLMASAAMDRLVHRGIKIVVEGKSYRLENFDRKTKRESKKP